MSDWRYVGCPNCHLNRFSVKTKRETQAVRYPTLPVSAPAPQDPPQRQAISTFQVECQNCRHVLVALARAA